MGEREEITINKRNEIIRGGNTYSLSAQKLGNAIYHHVQLNEVFSDERFMIPVSTVRDVMGLRKTNAYQQVIEKSIKELAQPIELYNVDREIGISKKGQSTLWQVAQFLIEPKIIKIGKEKYIESQMSPTLRELISSSSEGNFTQLILNRHLNKVKSKHSYILYEYLKSFQNFNAIKNRVELSFERLDKMFNMENNKKYHYFSSFKPLLKRCIGDLNKNTDMLLKLESDKAHKKYYIYRIKNANNEKQRKNGEADFGW